MSPRIVLPGLERGKVKRVFRNAPYVALVIIILVASSIGVFYFHGVNPAKLTDLSSIYNPDWFARNNRSKKPPDISEYLKPPRTNTSLPDLGDILNKINTTYVHFLVSGRVPLLAWRLSVLDNYVTNDGWVLSSDTFLDYREEGRGDFLYEVIKPSVIVSGEDQITLISLWSPVYEVEARRFTPLNSNVSQLVFVPKISSRNGVLGVYISAERVSLDIRYLVYGSYIDESEIPSLSSTISYVKAFVRDNPQLQYFLGLPDGYFSLYPYVLDEINSLGINDSHTVHQAMSIIFSSLLLNYNISLTITRAEGDPVANFVATKNGSVIDYISTVAFFARALGIPSRVVLGYLGGEYNESLGMTMLTVRNLFMWIEVFDPGAGGWVPYNCLAFITGDVLNLVDNSIILPYLYVQAPRYIQNYPCVYLDENFTLVFILYGYGAGGLTGYVEFYDVNESVLLGRVSLEKIDENTARAVLVVSYEMIYNRLGVEPKYGVHLIKAVFGKLGALGFVGLLKRVNITP
ncbi:MAG: transglutaminase-like domain-containing protein [Candidatus Njordarchaeales archaeon]